MARFPAMMMAVLLVAAGLLLGNAAPSQAATVTATINGISYSGDNASFTATVTRYAPPGFGSTVTLPRTVTLAGNTYTVTTIGDGAFYGTNLWRITFPDSVTTIGTSAFANNQMLEVTLPDSLISIGGNAFANNSLTHVTIPDRVTTINDYTFRGNVLTQVTLPDSLTSIGDFAFFSNMLRQVTLPDSLTSIGGYAFASNRLHQVTLPNNVTSIKIHAFTDNQLTQVTLSDNLTTISESAFISNQLTQVTIPGSVTSIGYRAFDGNAGLHSVVFEGAAPTTFTAAVEGFAASGSLGDPNTGVVVSYLKQFESTGFTSPVWQGYASRAILEDFTVTFDPQDGTTVDPATVTNGDPVTAPADPTRDGYTFIGWYTSTDTTPANAYDFTTPVTANLTLYAGWEPVPAAVITNPEKDTSPGNETGHGQATSPGSDTGENRLAATGADQSFWFPVTATMLLTAGALLLVSRSRRETQKA